MVNVMTGRKKASHHRFKFFAADHIIPIWNYLAKFSLFHCFSCHCFLYLYFKSEFKVFSQVLNTREALIVGEF